MWRALCALAITRSVAFAGACPGDAYLRVEAPAAVPTNPELRVAFGREAVRVYELGPQRQILAEGDASVRDATPILRTAGGAEVPVTLRRALNMPHPYWLVRPVKALAPHTAYVVSVRTPARDFQVASFTTGDGPDDEPPALDRVTRAQLARWPEANDWKAPSGRYAELAFAGLRGAVGVEIHELADGEAPSETTLRAIAAGETIRLGVVDACSGINYRLGPAKIWVRAFDAAGNVSPLREATLQPEHGQRVPRGR